MSRFILHCMTCSLSMCRMCGLSQWELFQGTAFRAWGINFKSNKGVNRTSSSSRLAAPMLPQMSWVLCRRGKGCAWRGRDGGETAIEVYWFVLKLTSCATSKCTRCTVVPLTMSGGMEETWGDHTRACGSGEQALTLQCALLSLVSLSVHPRPPTHVFICIVCSSHLLAHLIEDDRSTWCVLVGPATTLLQYSSYILTTRVSGMRRSYQRNPSRIPQFINRYLYTVSMFSGQLRSSDEAQSTVTIWQATQNGSNQIHRFPVYTCLHYGSHYRHIIRST